MGEIERATAPGLLRVVAYYGAARAKITAAQLAAADVVLTTYPVLEYAYRQCVDREKVQCAYCKRKFLARSLRSHNFYFCGPNAKRTQKQAKTEKSRKEQATKKAMATLHIGVDRSSSGASSSAASAGAASASTAPAAPPPKRATRRKGSSMPTPSNIYRDLMAEANRAAVPMYVSSVNAEAYAKSGGSAARANAAGGAASPNAAVPVPAHKQNNRAVAESAAASAAAAAPPARARRSRRGSACQGARAPAAGPK